VSKAPLQVQGKRDKKRIVRGVRFEAVRLRGELTIGGKNELKGGAFFPE